VVIKFLVRFGLEDRVGKILKEGDQKKKGQTAKLARIDEEGVTFTSHLDGSKHRFTPESSIKIQEDFRS